MREEEKIQDAVTEEIKKSEDEMDEQNESACAEDAKRKKREYYVEAALFLVLGILVGIAIKTEAVKKITMGFDDYKMKMESQDYNINKLQSDLAKERADQDAASQADAGSAQDNGSADEQGVAQDQNQGEPTQVPGQ